MFNKVPESAFVDNPFPQRLHWPENYREILADFLLWQITLDKWLAQIIKYGSSENSIKIFKFILKDGFDY